jgi:hypothetical protein
MRTRIWLYWCENLFSDKSRSSCVKMRQAVRVLSSEAMTSCRNTMPTLEDGWGAVEFRFAPLKWYELRGLQQNSTAHFRHSERMAPSFRLPARQIFQYYVDPVKRLVLRNLNPSPGWSSQCPGPSNLVHAGKLLVSVREVFGLNLDRVLTTLTEVHNNFPHSLQKYSGENTVAYRPIARQRPRNKRDNGRY